MAAVITMGTGYGAKSVQAQFITKATLAGDSSYPTNGYDIGTLLDLKDYLKSHTVVHVDAQEDGNYRYAYIPSTGKLKFLALDTGVEVAGSTDVSAATAITLTIFSE